MITKTFCTSVAALATVLGAAAQVTPPAPTSGPLDATTAAPALAPLFSLPPLLSDALGTSSSPTGTTNASELVPSGVDPFTPATSPRRSPFDDSPIFVMQRSTSLGLSSGGLSNDLLDSLLDTSNLFDPASSITPTVGAGSGATFGGGAPVSEFCRPEDFTCR